jgi:hypothetical protein
MFSANRLCGIPIGHCLRRSRAWRVWGDVAHEVIQHPQSLPAKLLPLFRRALAEAAASRRRAG